MSDAMHTLLAATPLLDVHHPDIEALVARREWRALPPYDRIGAAYDFVRNEIAFGYNEGDELPASSVLADGIGQCNTKSTLLMALLRAVGISMPLPRFHHRQALAEGSDHRVGLLAGAAAHHPQLGRGQPRRPAGSRWKASSSMSRYLASLQRRFPQAPPLLWIRCCDARPVGARRRMA